MSVSVNYAATLNTVEVLQDGVPASVNDSDKDVRHNGFNTALNPLPGATKVAYFEAQLTAGSGSIDFTALPQVNGASLDATGLKVKAVKFKAPSGNAGAIAIETGAADGLDLGIEVTELLPGKEVLALVNEAAVGSGEKILDLSGTGSDKLQVAIILGT